MLKAIPTELSKENILRIVSQEEIFEKVANIKTRAGIFSSPFRKDLHPSCSFRTSMNGKLYLVDWTTSEYVDCFTAVMKKYDLTFRESLQRINTVLALKLGSFYELSYTAEPTTSKNKYVEYSFVSGV